MFFIWGWSKVKATHIQNKELTNLSNKQTPDFKNEQKVWTQPKKIDGKHLWWKDAPYHLSLETGGVNEERTPHSMSLAVSYEVRNVTVQLGNPTPRHLPSELKTHPQMFNIAPLLTFSKNWRQALSIGEVVVYPYNGILFSDEKEGAIDSHTQKWMTLKCTLLNQRS